MYKLAMTNQIKISLYFINDINHHHIKHNKKKQKYDCKNYPLRKNIFLFA